MEPHLAAPIRIGDVVSAKYRIESIVGHGGMATVYAATHLELEDHVALKFLNPEYATSETVVARFVQEARAMFRLKSPHVGKVLDVGKHEGTPYIVLELLEGDTLEQLVRTGGPMRPELAREITFQACEGIAEAHALGIIHRDIKPMNLFVSRATDGRPFVKVLDFGLSKVRREAAYEASLTNKGDVMGTLRYMAPEQLQHSAEANELSDIFSLGAVLYRALTADFALVGRNDVELAAALMKRRPIKPVHVRRPGVPEDLARITMRCLAFEPSERYANVRELQAALRPRAAIEVGLAPTELELTGPDSHSDEDVTLEKTGVDLVRLLPPPSSEGATEAMVRPPLAAPPPDANPYVDEEPTPHLKKEHLLKQQHPVEKEHRPEPPRRATLDMAKPAAPMRARSPSAADAIAAPAPPDRPHPRPPVRQTVRLAKPPAATATPSVIPPMPSVIPPPASLGRTQPHVAPSHVPPPAPSTARPPARSQHDDPTALVRRNPPPRPPPVIVGVATGAILAFGIVVVIMVILSLLK